MPGDVHWWSNGRILACHAGGPGSIPGQCRSLFIIDCVLSRERKVRGQRLHGTSMWFPSCSGYHVRLTRERSPVRNRAETCPAEPMAPVREEASSCKSSPVAGFPGQLPFTPPLNLFFTGIPLLWLMLGAGLALGLSLGLGLGSALHPMGGDAWKHPQRP